MTGNVRIAAARARRRKTWGLAELKLEGAIAKVALAAQPNITVKFSSA